MSINRAMVLSAGLGTRIRSLAPELPKPLIEVAGKPLLDWTLDSLAAGGVSRAVVNVHHKADQIEAHLKGRHDPEIVISDERDELLETGGGIIKALPLLGDEAFFSTNTDAILLAEEEAPAETLRRQWDDRMDALLLLVPLERTSGYAGNGDFDLNEDGRIVKPEGGAPYVFTGLQILRSRLFEGAEVRKVSTSAYWKTAMAEGRMFGALLSGDWMHVGDPEGHRIADQRLRAEARKG